MYLRYQSGSWPQGRKEEIINKSNRQNVHYVRRKIKERDKWAGSGKQTGWEGCDETVTQQGGDGLSHRDVA